MRVCRASVREDVPRLKTLWKCCFGDDEDYIDHYFDVFYAPERVGVLEEEGVQSMLLTFPVEVLDESGEVHKGCYIYAFCTHPHAQGRGYGKELLRWAEVRAAELGCVATLVVPGEESLFRFYEKLGYGVTLSHCDLSLTALELPYCDAPLVPLTAAEYAALRKAYLGSCSRIDPAAETLDYQLRLCKKTGGGFYRLCEGIAAVEIWDGWAEVKELLSEEPEKDLAQLCSALRVEGAHAYLPRGGAGEVRPFCQVKPLTAAREAEKAVYFAFAFD